jgi:Putative transposase
MIVSGKPKSGRRKRVVQIRRIDPDGRRPRFSVVHGSGISPAAAIDSRLALRSHREASLPPRIGRHLEREGLLVRDLDSSHLALEPMDTEDALTDLQGHSITYRIAMGPHKGRKAFMLQSLPPRGEPPGSERVAQASGFSLHAGVAAGADQRGTLERLCRYIARPAVAIERLSRTAQGQIRYALKTPYRLRAQIVPGKRGRGGSGEGQGSAVPQRHAMTWAQRLKRVFGIEIESCEQCGGAVKIIASIEDPQVIGRILEHLGRDGSGAPSHQLPPVRAPPIGFTGLFD